MEIWLDTINVNLIQEAHSLGILDGVTTNPSLLSASLQPIKETLKDIIKVRSDIPLTIQVISATCEEMAKEGLSIHSMAYNIVVKVPVSQEGYKAIHKLTMMGIPTMATVVFTPQQALLAAKAGASYVAPYVGRMETNGIDPWQAMGLMLKMFKNYDFQTKVIAASLKDVAQVMRCAELGVDAVTLKDALFQQLVQTELLTSQGINQFVCDWNKATGSTSTSSHLN